MSNTIGLEAARQVGGLLQHARASQDLTLEDVAKQAGISERRLRQIEKGETPRGGEVRATHIPRNRLMALCEILRIEAPMANQILKLAGYQPLADLRDVVYLSQLPADAQDQIREIANRYLR